MMLVSIARMPLSGFCGDPGVHLFHRFRFACVGEAVEDVLGPGWREGGHQGF